MLCRRTEVAEDAEIPADFSSSSMKGISSSLELEKLEASEDDSLKVKPQEKPNPAAAMASVLRELQLDDWEIKAGEIEIVLDPDGSQSCLGQGAFGQVRAFTYTSDIYTYHRADFTGWL